MYPFDLFRQVKMYDSILLLLFPTKEVALIIAGPMISKLTNN